MSRSHSASVACPKCGVSLSKYERKHRLFWQWALFRNARRYKCHNCGKSSLIFNFNGYRNKAKTSSTKPLEIRKVASKAVLKRLTESKTPTIVEDATDLQKNPAPQSHLVEDQIAAQVETKTNPINAVYTDKSFFRSLSGYLTSSHPSPAAQHGNDILRGINVAVDKPSVSVVPPPSISVSNRQEIRAMLNFPNRFVRYQNTTTVEEEIEAAKSIHSELQKVINVSMTDLRRSRHFELEPIQKSTHKLIESMIRNPDATLLLSKLIGTNSIAYTHCVDASILAVFFGRHMGLTQEELNTLALGTLLLDIGKTQLPKAVLENQSQLTHEEIMLLHKHVQFSLEILGDKDIDEDVLSIIENHHERYDGRGYPQHKEKMEIPFLAKIASIIDAYSAMTHHRPYRNALTPSNAVEALQQQRGVAFQPELIDEFTHSLGVYPIGSMVVLSTGEAGIVISQNQVKRLQPKVLIFRDNKEDSVIAPFTRDLEAESLGDDGQPVFIKAA